MLSINNDKPCKIVYSICQHAYFGYLIEPHIVQLNAKGDFTLTHQRLFSHTATQFAKHLNEEDIRLIKLLDELEQDYLIKKYYKKTIRANVFFANHFDDKFLAMVRPKIEQKVVEVLAILQSQDRLYLMDKDGWPVSQKVSFASESATVLFHFRRSETETRYFPTLKYQGLRIEFMFKQAQLISNQPAWLLLEGVLYFFDQAIEGKKLQPFFNKRYISISKSTEETYFRKFVAPLIEKYHVYAEGFEIKTTKQAPSALLKVVYVAEGVSQLQLCFGYGEHQFAMGNGQKVTVILNKEGDNYTFTRIKRDVDWEQQKFDALLVRGLKKASALFYNLELATLNELQNPAYAVMNWINENIDFLNAEGYEIIPENAAKKFVFGANKIEFDVKEENDWFDIQAVVYFGSYPVPFMALKNYILHKKKEFPLPDGNIAIIPDKWFTQYSSLFNFSQGDKELKLKKYHIGLIDDLAEDSLANVTLNRKIEKLIDFEQIDDVAMPQHFKGSLRDYQKAGYNWFMFLQSYGFGGCLADDMGLGKTIQTLAMLQKVKEDNGNKGIPVTSLIVVPTSLIYNWLSEAKKFAPQLKIRVYAGSARKKDLANFSNYDLVITTYGVTRIDIEAMSEFYFHYVILDESQNIKNPTSKAFKAVRLLRSKYRLALSGTPVENSVGDLWTQLTFLNAGLLGTQRFFTENYVQAIEKRKDEDKAQKLQALIKPFVLRRTKEQVAVELPPKTENILYCEMSEDQANYYEKTKSAYRNDLLSSLDEGNFAKKQVQILQGLTALRQLANHPVLIDQEYQSDSGKFKNIVHTLDNVLKGGHRVLIFSQFVKHLTLLKNHLEQHHISYRYLDGGTRNRGEVVTDFQDDESIQVFLISIKAGGVGLNLTQADYVFILDPWWNPAVEQQAIDRTHRIGQEKKVFIYKFIAKDSVEEKILALQNRKKKMADSLITTEESFFKSLSKEDIKSLLD